MLYFYIIIKLQICFTQTIFCSQNFRVGCLFIHLICHFSHQNTKKKNEKISTASLKNSKDVSAPSSRFSKYGGLGNMNRKYLEMQFLCTYVGIVSIMAFELCTCSWKANVYTPIFPLSSTKKALYLLFTKRDPKVLQCIYHTLDSGRDKYVEKSFPIAYSAHTLYVLFLSPWKQV